MAKQGRGLETEEKRPRERTEGRAGWRAGCSGSGAQAAAPRATTSTVGGSTACGISHK